MISRTSLKLASPGMQPSVAHEPKATRILDFCLSNLAMCSFSSLRMPPLKSVSRIEPSSMASTSLYLASIATGQKTTSKLASRSRIFSLVFNTAISHPPQEAAQYIANFGFALMRAPHLFEGTLRWKLKWRRYRRSFPNEADRGRAPLPQRMRPRWRTWRPPQRKPKPTATAPVQYQSLEACASSTGSGARLYSSDQCSDIRPDDIR